ncbi:hypothetical protein AZE42_02261 [Rhizopogon vesiculosus]|uniref:Protein kinase domain-containing protein n=1 Tax=Rhizopogon vesiculosus TaxID=180088 RepID=A0A1J8RCB8_9AGAM|nr:hypothetical protein AZE42_02261 [Rhizopogon vesiculosus]
MNFISLFKMLLKIFRRITLRTRQVQSSSSLDDETWRQRIRDLTGQLCNISQYPTAYGGYSDVWKCDWIKDGTVVKVAAKTIRQQGTSDDALSKALKVCPPDVQKTCMRTILTERQTRTRSLD